MQFCPDAEYRKSKIGLEIAGGSFVAQARNLVIAGWRALLGKEDSLDDAEPLLPIVKKGQILHCEQGEIVSKKHNRPATLLIAVCFQQ